MLFLAEEHVAEGQGQQFGAGAFSWHWDLQEENPSAGKGAKHFGTLSFLRAAEHKAQFSVLPPCPSH